MRQIILDTETSGLDFRKGHRIVEIGCIEMIGRKPTQRRFHTYLNPECPIEAGAQAIHGLTNESLQDKPKFAEVAADFLEFIQGAELLIHNAEFDRGFLDNELGLLGRPLLDQVCSGIVDTLKLARDLRPGRKNSLDALCKEFDVDNSGRQLHGALLDAELLAEVYLAMTRGQENLLMDLDETVPIAIQVNADGVSTPRIVLRASSAELLEHDRVLAEIAKASKGKCLWQADAESAAG
jgi:DNA polymerase-3 subunit epsilon